MYYVATPPCEVSMIPSQTESTTAVRTALISAEAVPFAKTGGLGDAVGGLGRALAAAGHDVVVVLPKYRSIGPLDGFAGGEGRTEADIDLTLAGARYRGVASRRTLAANLGALFIDLPELFDRPGLYGDDAGPYADNLLRFSAFCRAALQALRSLDLRRDVLHAHDWQAAMVPFVLKFELPADPFYAASRSLLTIHNLAYQGHFPAPDYPATGLDAHFFDVGFTEFYGGVNLLKAGIVAADAINTVSPTYAREVMTPESGAGLDGVLRDRHEDFTGILNGIDAQIWDPATDARLPCRYRAGALQGKGKCKRALLQETGLPPGQTHPLIGVVSRLVAQKGMDLLPDIVVRLHDTGVRWVVLGSGDAAIEERLRVLASRHPERVAVCIGFDEDLAHRIQAGADYLLMPSRFEPCGLNPMYAMRYGTIPVVSAVGGLVDTVIDAAADADSATGFIFADVSVAGAVAAVRRALRVYRQPRVWPALRRRALEKDFSWPRSAEAYVRLYRAIMARPPAPAPAGPA
jgi:starch synthase